MLRSIAGLPHADENALVRAYRSFLINATVSPAMARLERALNYFCPKSLILYAEKRRSPRRCALHDPAADRVRRLPRQHAVRRPGRVSVVPRARARAARPPRRRLGRPALPRPDAVRAQREPLRNHQYWGKWFSKDRRALIPTPRTRLLNPLEFYELGASYIGFLPEPFAFSVRALRALAARLRAGERYDVVHDVQCLGWGLLGVRALGLPVVTTVHHPLTVDRRSSFLRDRTCARRSARWSSTRSGMQSFVARRVDRLFTSSEVSARQIERDFGVARERIRMVANGVDTDLFCPDPAVARDPHEVLCVGPRERPEQGRADARRGDRGAAAADPAHARRRSPPRQSGAPTRARAGHRRPRGRGRARARGDARRLVPARCARRGAVAVRGLRPARAEAMACGTPVGRDRGRLAARGDRTAGGGILVSAHSADALARGIAELLAQPAARAELGALGRKGVVAAYSWPSVARRTAEVYAEVAATRGRPAITTTSALAGQ
jgi:glycosyltransferase involved in cell wall biosynthesis